MRSRTVADLNMTCIQKRASSAVKVSPLLRPSVQTPLCFDLRNILLSGAPVRQSQWQQRNDEGSGSNGGSGGEMGEMGSGEAKRLREAERR